MADVTLEMIDAAEANIRADHRAGKISKEQFQKELLIVTRARQQANADTPPQPKPNGSALPAATTAEVFCSVDAGSAIGKRAEELHLPTERDEHALGQNVVDDAHVRLIGGAASHEALREIARARSSPSRREDGDPDDLARLSRNRTPSTTEGAGIRRPPPFRRGGYPMSLVELKATHLMEWLHDGYNHCRYGSEDWCKSYLTNAREYITALEATNARLQKEIETAREALEPFVRQMEREFPDQWPDAMDVRSLKESRWHLKVGDFRRASAAYLALKDKEVAE